jgi:hypothetical protein
MQPDVRKAEIEALESELTRYQQLLDKSIEANEELAKTKAIFHELKMIQERLAEIKRA